MRILVVEDDDLKRKTLVQFIIERLGGVTLAEGRSFQSGMKEVVATTPDLILLDMSIPTFDHSPVEPGGRVRAFGGLDFLEELSRLEIETKVIVVSQFDSFGGGKETQTLEELCRRMKTEFPELFCGSVFYQSSETAWRAALSAQMTLLGLGRDA